jgi:hypothetical protein
MTRGYARRGWRRETAAAKKEGGGRGRCGRGAGYGGGAGGEAACGGGSEGGVLISCGGEYGVITFSAQSEKCK